MTTTSKPLWKEGMLIRPQHFQQYDRWIEHSLTERTAGLAAFGWGIRTLDIAEELLPLGRFGITRLKAAMPDGTVIDIPVQVPPPPPRMVPAGTKSALVKLAVAIRAQDGAEVSVENSPRRYRAIEQPVRDSTAPERAPTPLGAAQLSVRLLIEGEPEEECITLPIARIREIDASGAVQLDAGYAPPSLDIHACAHLVQMVNEIRSLLRSRAEALAGSLSPDRLGSETASLIDMLVLTIINGREALFEHFAATPGVHPERLYSEIARLAGELATFSPARRRAQEFPPYSHLDVVAALAPILDLLRQQLAIVIERNTLALPLQDRGYGIMTAMISDRTIFQDCQFVLVALASMPPENLRSQFPAALKIGSVEQIRELVNLQLPGIPVRALPAAPRALPYMQNAVYFELDHTHELWRNLVRSAAFAFHVSGDFPGLNLEFWAIRGQRT